MLGDLLKFALSQGGEKNTTQKGYTINSRWHFKLHSTCEEKKA
jgi:hypothetical protein